MTKNRILIVNDDQDIINTLSSILRARNYAVSAVSSGVDGLERAKVERPSLILLDVALPDTDGYNVCSKLRSDRVTKSIPVIMISSNGGSESVMKARTVGADDYIAKPFNLFTLLGKLRKFLVD